MDSRKLTGPVAPALNYEDFDPDYDLVQEPQVDTLLIYLPGFKKEQIRVQLTGAGILRISGQRQLDGDKWKRFLKQFPVSSNCDTNRISAKFESGTLHITQPKLIIPAEKPEPETFPEKPAAADVTEERPKEAAEASKKGEDSGSESEATKPENASDKKLGNGSDKEPVKEDSAVAANGNGAVAGKAKRMDDYGNDNAAAEMEQLKRARKMMNVALVIVLVVGVGLYLKDKMRWSSNDAGEL